MYVKFLSICLSALLLTACLVDSDTNSQNIDAERTLTGQTPSTEDLPLAGQETFARTLTALSSNVFTPNFDAFANKTQLLEAAINDYCAQLSAGSDATNLAAESAWKAAMSQWQRILAGQIAPITDNDSLLGGRIYSWPKNVNTCTVDIHVILNEAEEFTIESKPRESKGLDALEYLLFNTDLNHTCSSQITTTEDWNEREPNDKKAARCAFAETVSADLSDKAQLLVNNWQDYQQNFTEAGTANSQFETTTEALNQITDSLFYLDKEVKDRKLGSVLGFDNQTRSTCSEPPCQSLIESPLSGASLTQIRDNLVGFRTLFIASLEAQADSPRDQLGFDYQLAVKNFRDRAADITQGIDQAINLIDGLNITLSSAIEIIDENDLNNACINASSSRTPTSGVEVCALHGIIKSVTDILKTDFLTIITLSLPERVEGDND